MSKGRSALKPIVHHIFEECSNICDDPFWKRILHTAALDKFPRGFIYTNGVMMHRRGVKTSSRVIPEDPEEALEVFCSYVREVTGLRSVADEESEIERTSKLTGETRVYQPTDLKVKSIRDILITRFIESHTRTRDQEVKLRSLIYIGISLHYFSKASFIMENGEIVSISGLVEERPGDFRLEPSQFVKIKQTKSKIKYIPNEKIFDPNYRPLEENLVVAPILILWDKYLKTSRAFDADSHFSQSEEESVSEYTHETE